MLPPLSTLKKQFFYVSDLFDGRPWTNHESVPTGILPASLDRMELICFNRKITSEEAIKEKAETHRPATHEELYAYSQAYPEAGKGFWIVALGSFTVRDVDRRVAILDGSGAERNLGSVWFVAGWDADDRFLFVRKSPLEPGTLGTSGSLVLDPLDAWETERRHAWDQYMASAMRLGMWSSLKEKSNESFAEGASTQADAMLAERDKRFKKLE